MTKEEFEALIERYLSGNASEKEKRMIDDFFSAHENKEYGPDPSMTEAMWENVRKATMPEPEEGVVGEARKHKRTWLVASVMGLVLAVAVYFFTANPFAPGEQQQKWITLDAPYGQKSIIALPDGTRIFLNGGGVLSYPEVFRPEMREVKLSGEAFFEVARNPNQPFVVTAGGVVTKVLGTSFNIQAFPRHKVSVTVATGSVQVEIDSDNDGDAPQRAILKPNDQAVYRPGEERFTVSQVDIEKFLAWKDNTLFFQDMPLADVATTLERWYNVSIVFESDLIKGCRINGKYTDQSLESVLQSIRYMYKIDFEFKPNNIIHLKGTGCRDDVMDTS